MSDFVDKFVKLKDGRQIAFTEHGASKGMPVFFFHGNPGCRYQRHPDEHIAEELGVRIITPDRPGYGLSDSKPHRKLLDYPDDIEELANHLELDSFSIFGVSAGGPYVAVCAYKLSHRISQAAIVSGASPIDRPGAFDGMHAQWRTAFEMGKRVPAPLLKISMQLHSEFVKLNPEKAIDHLGYALTKYDRMILSNPEIREGIIKRQIETIRQGVDGIVDEAKVITAPWGFDLEEIMVPIHLWYWEDDPSVPLQMGKYMESKIPNTIPHFYKGGGHLAIFEFWRKILENLN